MSLLIGGVMSLFGALLLFGGVRRLGTAISVWRTEAIPVRDVAQTDGTVEFDGRAEPPGEGAFAAPFSGEDALCCNVWMETNGEYRTDADGVEVLGPQEVKRQRNTRTSWRLAQSDDVRRPFVVAEDGHRVRVDPVDATLDIMGHMGETVLTVDAGESLPADVRERLRALAQQDVAFDCDPDTWDDQTDTVRYREARLEPGELVHVANGAVERVPEEWGSDVAATVGASESGGSFTVSEGTEATVVRSNLVQFTTGVLLGSALLVVGLSVAGLLSL